MVHRRWDKRAQQDIGPHDVVIFRRGRRGPAGLALEPPKRPRRAPALAGHPRHPQPENSPPRAGALEQIRSTGGDHALSDRGCRLAAAGTRASSTFAGPRSGPTSAASGDVWAPTDDGGAHQQSSTRTNQVLAVDLALGVRGRRAVCWGDAGVMPGGGQSLRRRPTRDAAGRDAGCASSPRRPFASGRFAPAPEAWKNWRLRQGSNLRPAA